MNTITYRWMNPAEVTKIADIDRAERIRTGYKVTQGNLLQMEVNWDSPPWLVEGDGEYSVRGQIQFCQEHLDRNGRMVGAFDGSKLVGIGLIQPQIEEGIAQLAFLHVSNHYRRHGIGQRLTEELIREARKSGAKKIYVSATPSGSAVGFYLSQGFKLAEKPNPTLLALEPDDIHLIKDL